jgi:hypothetical protein
MQVAPYTYVSAEELVQIEGMAVQSRDADGELTALQIVIKILKIDENVEQDILFIDAADGAGTAEDDDDLL